MLNHISWMSCWWVLTAQNSAVKHYVLYSLSFHKSFNMSAYRHVKISQTAVAIRIFLKTIVQWTMVITLIIAHSCLSQGKDTNCGWKKMILKSLMNTTSQVSTNKHARKCIMYTLYNACINRGSILSIKWSLILHLQGNAQRIDRHPQRLCRKKHQCRWNNLTVLQSSTCSSW